MAVALQVVVHYGLLVHTRYENRPERREQGFKILTPKMPFAPVRDLLMVKFNGTYAAHHASGAVPSRTHC